MPVRCPYLYKLDARKKKEFSCVNQSFFVLFCVVILILSNVLCETFWLLFSNKNGNLSIYLTVYIIHISSKIFYCFWFSENINPFNIIHENVDSLIKGSREQKRKPVLTKSKKIGNDFKRKSKHLDVLTQKLSNVCDESIGKLFNQTTCIALFLEVYIVQL